jgi:hypothetical protein
MRYADQPIEHRLKMVARYGPEAVVWGRRLSDNMEYWCQTPAFIAFTVYHFCKRLPPPSNGRL